MKKRVLVWGLTNNRAGTEAVISTYVKASKNIIFDFLCYDEPANFSFLFDGTENEYFIIPIKIKHPFANQKALNGFMKKRGHLYSSLWFNVNEVSNIDLLKLAKKHNIPQRITHIHNPSFPNVFITKLFSRLNWRKCLELSTDYWACSEDAGKFLFRGKPFRVIPNLIDVESRAFSESKRSLIRDKYGLNRSFVIGAVGRLAEQKNISFLVGLMPRLLALNPKVVLMLVGSGSLYPDLKRLAEDLNIENNIIFAGSQTDIQGYLSAFDVYAMPSLYEGMSLSILEAQFNGLPCVISEGVGEKSAISNNVKVISLDDESVWIDALLSAKRREGSIIEERAKLYRFDRAQEVVPTMFKQNPSDK